MVFRRFFFRALCIGMAIFLTAAGSISLKAGSPNQANTAIDGNTAIQGEFDIALGSNSIEQLEIFILRHPNHALVVEAKKALAKLKTKIQDN